MKTRPEPAHRRERMDGEWVEDERSDDSMSRHRDGKEHYVFLFHFIDLSHTTVRVEMPDDFGALNCRTCGQDDGAGGGHAGRATLPCSGLGETALPCGHAGRAILPRADRGFCAVLPEPAFLTFLLPPSFLLPLFLLRQKEEGAIPCRSPGEAVGCPIRTTERRCAQGAHSPLRLSSHWRNFLHFT